jgi:flagellin
MVTGNGVDGGDFKVSMTVIQAGISQMQTSQMFMDKNTGDLAKGNTKLEDISQFYDENGVFALASAQTLTVTGNAKTASVNVDGKMTLDQLASALQNAIAGASNLGIRNSSVAVVSTAQSNVSGLGGYLQLTSGAVGEEGNFSIAGDQSVIDALGLSVSRQSVNNIVQLRIEEANGNVRTVNTSSDRASGLLDGMDIQFDSRAAQIAGHGGVVDGLKFTAAESIDFSFKVGTVQKDVTLNFAADSKYSMEGIAKAINKEIEAQAPNSGMEATVVDGQIRLAYNPTDPSSPTEITINADAEVLGFNAGTYTGFVDGDKNMENAIKGISQLATAAGTALEITITDGAGGSETISVGSTVEAGSADLVEANEFMKNANDKLAAATVNARVDIVNGSIAFTSTILGNLNNDGAAATKGTINVASSDEMLNNMLGYKDGTAKGAGDTNFKIHVVNNNSQFQIGANAGQRMEISIGDMSAKALGIDKLDMSTTEGAQSAIEKLDQALARVSAERSKLGAYSNRLNYTMNNLENTATNLTDAESRVRDADMAAEMINFTSAQIMQQAGTAMLAQANAMGQSVLSLLG